MYNYHLMFEEDKDCVCWLMVLEVDKELQNLTRK